MAKAITTAAQAAAHATAPTTSAVSLLVLHGQIFAILRMSLFKRYREGSTISNCQHGFRSKRSCVTQLLEVMERITFYFDNGQPVDILYLAFR